MKAFKLISLIEGISLILLLFVAVPLKYQFNIDGPVFFVGMAHGSLFLCYLISSLATSHKQGWSVLAWCGVFFAGIIPLGFIAVDRWLKGANDASMQRVSSESN